MTSQTNRIIAICSLILLIIIGFIARKIYLDMEVIWVAESNTSALRGQKSMLAAQRFLAKSQTVTEYDSMPEALRQPLPAGTILLTSNEGFLLPKQVDTILAWVRAGNTLIMLPRNPDEVWGKRGRKKASASESASEDSAEDDPFAADFAKMRASDRGGVDNPLEEEADSDTESDADEESASQPASANSSSSSAKNTEDDNVQEDDASAVKTNPASKLEQDPFGKLLDVRQGYESTRIACNKKCAPIRLQLPNLDYPLLIAVKPLHLLGDGHPDQLVAADEDGEAVRIYREGKGHIAVLADNYFSNLQIQHFDHAELLLRLSQLNATGKHMAIIRNLDFLPWHQALWDSSSLPLISAMISLLLLLWMGLRRFGNLLPEPVQIRRALIEHIDGSARWLWHLPGGPGLLLGAARTNTQAVLQRRIPEWKRLSPQEQVERLLGDAKTAGKLNQQQLWLALHEQAAKQIMAFTAQVQTLQTLRKQYERK